MIEKLSTILALSIALAIAPVAAYAAPPQDDPAAAAQAAYERGVAAYDTSDYEAAVEAFREAFESAREIEDEQQRGFVAAALWFNLARAQSKAYDIDRDEKRLRQAQDLIRKYMALDLDASERAEAVAVQNEIEAKLGGSTAPTTGPEPDTVDSAPDKDSSARPGRRLVITGAVLSGLGVVAGGALIGTGAALAGSARDEFRSAPDAAGRDDALDKGSTANAVGVAGVVAGGLLLVTGISLLAVGVSKNRSGSGKVSAAPMFGRGQAGIALNFRF